MQTLRQKLQTKTWWSDARTGSSHTVHSKTIIFEQPRKEMFGRLFDLKHAGQWGIQSYKKAGQTFYNWWLKSEPKLQFTLPLRFEGRCTSQLIRFESTNSSGSSSITALGSLKNCSKLQTSVDAGHPCFLARTRLKGFWVVEVIAYQTQSKWAHPTRYGKRKTSKIGS